MESMLKKVKLKFDSFSNTALPLSQKIPVEGSMSVIIAGGFKNRLTGISGFSHEDSFLFRIKFEIVSGFTEDKL